MSDHRVRREPTFSPHHPAAAEPGGPSPGAPRVPPPPPGAFAGPRAIYRPPEPPAAPPARRRGAGRLVLYGLLAVLAVVVAGATFLVVAPPTELVQQRLVAEVKARTGRDLVITGPVRFSFLPALGLRAEGVTVSAPAGMEGEPLLVADQVDVRIAALPLIGREVQVERLVLQKPRIHLVVDRNGRRSWDFAAAGDLGGDGRVRLAQAAPRGDGLRRLPPEAEAFAKGASAQPQRGPGGGLALLSLADVRIIDGHVIYRDQRSGARHELDGVDLELALPNPAGPLDLAGTLALAGERLELSLKLASLSDVLEQRESKATATLKGRPLEASWDGLVTPGQAFGVDGHVTVKAASADALARFAGWSLAGGEGQPVVVEGQLRGQGQAFVLSSARLGLGDTAVQGRIGVDASGPRPQVQATLKVAHLDLDRLAAMRLLPLPAEARPALPPSSAPPPRSIEDLLERTTPPATIPGSGSGPQVKGFMRREGWSQERIDARALGALDLEGRFEIAGLAVAGMKVGATQAAVSLKGNVLRVNVSDARLYGGTARGLVTVDARQPTLAIGANLSGDGLQTLAFLKDAAGIDTVDGRGRFLVVASAQGGSERELVGTLNGRAEMTISDGHLIGWSVQDMIAGLASGRVPSFDRQPSARTPFSELAATMPIANGVGRPQDIRLKSPTLESTGGGVVNIVDRNIDITLKPKPAAGSGLGAIEVPVRIAGPWGEAKAVADVNAAMKSPAAQEAVKKLQSGDVEGALKSVLGDGPKAEEKINRAKDALRQLFGR